MLREWAFDRGHYDKFNILNDVDRKFSSNKGRAITEHMALFILISFCYSIAVI